ncbi:MAG: hypothetical protein ACXVHW_11320 [Methanobacterium sp.]
MEEGASSPMAQRLFATQQIGTNTGSSGSSGGGGGDGGLSIGVDPNILSLLQQLLSQEGGIACLCLSIFGLKGLQNAFSSLISFEVLGFENLVNVTSIVSGLKPPKSILASVTQGAGKG